MRFPLQMNVQAIVQNVAHDTLNREKSVPLRMYRYTQNRILLCDK